MQSFKAVHLLEVGVIQTLTKSRRFFSFLFCDIRYIGGKNEIPTGDFLANPGTLLENENA